MEVGEFGGGEKSGGSGGCHRPLRVWVTTLTMKGPGANRG